MTSLLSRLLTALAPWRTAPAWYVAYSGGLDSTVLLHLLATLARRETLPPLSAIHVHHGLQAAADAWPEHCRQQCAELGVSLSVRHVQVAGGASLERAAREARYAALAACLGAGEVLLTAQHRDDQAETLLFRLLRGAGVRGLMGMPQSRVLGQGILLRPLLNCSRAELEAYAGEHGLRWVEDPSNRDSRLARNYLRHQIMPRLLEYWPQTARNLARSAEHLREAQQLLDELAEQDLLAAQSASLFPWLNISSLELAPLLSLSSARQRNALRHWLVALTPLPDSDHWAGWEDLRDATNDAQPVWRLGQGELQRAGGRLWWVSGGWLQVPTVGAPWHDPAQALTLPGNGLLQIDGVAPQGPLEVRYRQGGELMRLAARGHRDLKRLLNEIALPGFVRGRLPLLYRGDELIAVANLPVLDGRPEEGWKLRWQVPTNDRGLS
ncbi:tRNA lysidine(34) synthetase TilS [Pseudomonas sp. LS44]|uniref:tRNA lysidine(34) synthetase TilS n=1 Tax=Pseudomonas sp. LS44 TaxID=1357074 RepID=UPI00215A6F5A|nr:tRNA lysidine(34) synthetase TilS [Pseudomonas sp. LS44]UVE16672.1 tRNA lysidine(34) synthetase TilS [Pseudomonas sp. LS44]